MDELTPHSVDAPAFLPNAAEKALGFIGGVTVAPLLIPMLPLLALLRWTTSTPPESQVKRIVKRALIPIAGASVFLAFLVICVVAIPYGALYGLLRLLGVVRKPPGQELEDDDQSGRPPDERPPG